jgi:hypothetical protein
MLLPLKCEKIKDEYYIVIFVEWSETLFLRSSATDLNHVNLKDRLMERPPMKTVQPQTKYGCGLS